jgi:hypothetical protein
MAPETKGMKMTRSELFVWIGSAGVFLSAVLGIVAVFFPYSWLIIVSLGLGGISAPTAILSARYAASEQQKQFEKEQRERETRDQQLYVLTPEGRVRRNLEQLHAHMSSNDTYKK